MRGLARISLEGVHCRLGSIGAARIRCDSTPGMLVTCDTISQGPDRIPNQFKITRLSISIFGGYAAISPLVGWDP